MNSYLLEQKIAVKKGIPQNKVRKIYNELERRARILKKIHESGVTGFYELFALLSKMEGEGVISCGCGVRVTGEVSKSRRW